MNKYKKQRGKKKKQKKKTKKLFELGEGGGLDAINN